MRAFQAENLPKPATDFDFRSLPPYDALDVEIGAGQGLHAIRYCLDNPGRRLIAIEKTHERFAKLQGRHERHPEVTNLSCVHADAVSFITHYLPDASIDRLFLLYPNPYPKASQANLRWHNRPFLETLLRKLKPGADFTLATNIESYKDEAKKLMDKTWDLPLIAETQLDSRHNPRTHFEKKYLSRGERCWNLLFRTRA